MIQERKKLSDTEERQLILPFTPFFTLPWRRAAGGWEESGWGWWLALLSYHGSCSLLTPLSPSLSRSLNSKRCSGGVSLACLFLSKGSTWSVEQNLGWVTDEDVTRCALLKIYFETCDANGYKRTIEGSLLRIILGMMWFSGGLHIFRISAFTYINPFIYFFFLCLWRPAKSQFNCRSAPFLR